MFLQIIDAVKITDKVVNEGFEQSFLVGVLMCLLVLIIGALVWMYIRSEKKDDKQNATLLSVTEEHNKALQLLTEQRLCDGKEQTSTLQKFMNNLFNDQKELQLQTNKVIQDYTNTLQLQTKTLETIAESNTYLKDEVKDIRRDIKDLEETVKDLEETVKTHHNKK